MITYKLQGKGTIVGIVTNINNDVLHIKPIGAYGEIDRCPIGDAIIVTKQYKVDDEGIHHYVDGNCGKGTKLVTKVVYHLHCCWDCVLPEV